MYVQIEPGTRVVRGPDWNSKKQDNGEGFLGTVIEPESDDRKVTVIWDSGRKLRYRAGENGNYDLRVFDTAPTGVLHPNITCDDCKEKGVHGIRWKCSDCTDYDLCNPCYMNDKHDLKHAFFRVDTPDSDATGVNVPARSASQNCRKEAKGMFPEAEVMRGPHWKWKNDDGGQGGFGYVMKLETRGKDSYRGAVKIEWKADSSKKNYRVGGEGCVDVIYTRMTENATGGHYYADHLPLVGSDEDYVSIVEAAAKGDLDVVKKIIQSNPDRATLDELTTKDKKFIRALMTAVCSSAITGKGKSAKVDPTRITLQGVILQKYLDHQAEFELQALYALQALVHRLEHPPGVLRTLFDTLYDEDIISEDAFNQWESSKDPAEQEGKGVAMKQVVQFFTWLREADDEVDS